MSPELLHRLEAIAASPILLVACDYDGTLAPIVADPALATPDPRALDRFAAAATTPNTHAALISGRAMADLRRLTGPPPDVELIGSHGAEWGGQPVALDPDQGALLRRLTDQLNAAAIPIPGLSVEIKPAGVALHYRNAADMHAAEALARRLAQTLGTQPGVRLRPGSRVLEFIVVKADKGSALRQLRHLLGATGVIFLGDDVTDEDAFNALLPGDLGVKVGDGDTAATVRVPDVDAVAQTLATLVDLRNKWISRRAIIPLDHCSILSDQRTVAVVGPGARLVWLCLPRLDSAALFAELIDGPEAGFFDIAPAAGGEPSETAYAEHTFTLVTRWPNLTVTDYLDASGGRAFQKAGRTDLLRVLEGAGEAVIRFRPRLDFGRIPTRLTIKPDGVAIDGSPDPVVLHAPGVAWQLTEENGHHNAEGRVTLADAPVVLQLRFGTASLRPAVVPEDERRKANHNLWSGWARALRLPATQTDLVRRSALVIKALCYGPTGAIAAAATTSLPEHLGGVRNWDYRFCWPRDAAMAAASLVRLGNTGHAVRFLDWMLGVVEKCDTPDCVRPIYTITGGHLPPEGELTHLSGYAGSRPVRVSNAAAHQMQFDVYGPIVDLVALLAEAGAPISREHWRLVRSMVDGVQARWNEPDHGIWEMRTDRRHHVHSKVMCWHTLDRALAVEDALLGRQSQEWIDLRAQIKADVLAHGFRQGVNAFTGAYGLDYPDASALCIGLSHLLDRDDPRWASTVDYVERNLRDGPIVRRYRTDDGLPGDACGFHLCTGWLIESFLTLKRSDDALALFNDLCRHAHGTNVLTEGYDPRHQLPIGNLAQVYSHLAVINAALAIDAASGTRP